MTTISVIPRTLDFEQKFLAVTEGRGVDVVLDSFGR